MAANNRIDEIWDEQLENRNRDEDITTKEELSRGAKEKAQAEEGMIYAETSSGSGKIAISEEYLRSIGEKVLNTSGVDENDVILNLGAPKPHLSGTAFRLAGEEIGAEVLTDHAGELEGIMERSDEVTTVASLPGMVKSTGQKIHQRYGKPEDVFKPKKALLGGEVITESWRDVLTEQWGFETTNEMYASSEGGIMLAELDSREATRRLIPQFDEIIYEIYPLNSENAIEYDSAEVNPDNLIDIRDVDEPTEGILYPTVPGIFSRYNQGDVVTVWPDDSTQNLPEGFPTVEPLGRVDCLNLAGAMIPEGKLERTLNEAAESSGLEWSAAAAGSREDSTLEVYVDDPISSDSFYDALEQHAHDVFYADEHGMIDSVQLYDVENPLDYIEGGEEGVKTNRMEDRR